jgi:hypothetical protein
MDHELNGVGIMSMQQVRVTSLFLGDRFQLFELHQLIGHVHKRLRDRLIQSSLLVSSFLIHSLLLLTIEFATPRSKPKLLLVNEQQPKFREYL